MSYLDIPCRVSAELRQYEMETDGDGPYPEEGEQVCSLCGKIRKLDDLRAITERFNGRIQVKFYECKDGEECYE